MPAGAPRKEPLAARGQLSAPVRQVVARFIEIVCPPQVRTGDRARKVLDEFELMLGAMPPVTRRALAAVFLAFDRGARLYPRARGRRFARLDDPAAEAYVAALLARHDGMAGVIRRIRGLVVLCYYELPEAQEEVGYRPAPYIAAVSRRRLDAYRAEIRDGEAAVLAPSVAGQKPGEAPGRRGDRQSGDQRADREPPGQRGDR